jgi:alginate O-acetyltransferase complex protein AlgI
MLFPTLQFLVFFAVFFTGYWLLARHRLRRIWLLLGSCLFYASWSPWFLLLILFTALVDYAVALALEQIRSTGWRRVLLIGSIASNLSLLAAFKYFDFFLESSSWLLSLTGVTWQPALLHWILPLGISFYTFETISYVVDVYRGRTRAVRGLLDYALFILFFPHLVAGPIVRAHHFLPQLQRPKHWSWNRLALGVQWFLLGFIKKAVIADHLAQVVDPVFASPAAYGSVAVWAAVLGYAVQIYSDFSGYSDMAIGLAHMLGFKLPLNFKAPYLSASPAEFWQRWHISLSSWLRDYLYIPLGGNRGGGWHTCRNLIVVMLLGGLWHGASWTFVLWGLYHGFLLALGRAVTWPALLDRYRFLRVAGTFTLVAFGWVLFRATTMTGASLLMQRLLVPTAGPILRPAALLLVAFCLVLTFLEPRLARRNRQAPASRPLPAPLVGALLAGLLLLALMLLPQGSMPFIYFQF